MFRLQLMLFSVSKFELFFPDTVDQFNVAFQFELTESEPDRQRGCLIGQLLLRYKKTRTCYLTKIIRFISE